MLGRRKASVNTGAFRFLREHFQPPALHVTMRIPPNFSAYDIICPIWLIGLQDFSSNWSGD